MHCSQPMKTRSMHPATEVITVKAALQGTVVRAPKHVRVDPLDELCTGRIMGNVVGSFEP